MLGTGAGFGMLDRLVAWAHPSHWPLHCLPRCHMSQASELNQSVTVGAQQLKGQGESESEVVIFHPQSAFGSEACVLLTQVVRWLLPGPVSCALRERRRQGSSVGLRAARTST